MDSKHGKKHLKRLSQVWESNPMCFITTCTRDRKPVLAHDEVVDILIGEWKQAISRHGWAIGSYVVMPDHVHFFCRASTDAKSLSNFVGSWKEWTSKKMVKKLQYSVPVWQKEFFDHVLRSDESYSEKWNYVRNNPVRAGMINRAEDWRYQGQVDYL
ncbi:transposase [Verrucomicrobiota bacterium]